MKFVASLNQLTAWGITVVANQYCGLRKFLPLVTIFAKAKKFKGMKQHLKVFRLLFRQFDVFYGTGLQYKGSSTINTSQVMVIPINWAIERFPCWKVSTPNQSFLLKSPKISINRCQAHIRRSFDQCAVELLPTDLIRTIVQLFQNLFLTVSKTRTLFDHSLSVKSQTFTNISLLLP